MDLKSFAIDLRTTHLPSTASYETALERGHTADIYRVVTGCPLIRFGASCNATDGAERRWLDHLRIPTKGKPAVVSTQVEHYVCRNER
jgi:hypothetical protein